MESIKLFFSKRFLTIMFSFKIMFETRQNNSRKKCAANFSIQNTTLQKTNYLVNCWPIIFCNKNNPFSNREKTSKVFFKSKLIDRLKNVHYFLGKKTKESIFVAHSWNHQKFQLSKQNKKLQETFLIQEKNLFSISKKMAKKT